MPNFKLFWDTIPNLRKGTIGGELYGFRMIARNESAFGFGPVIRTDLLVKHNIPVPKTFDELLNALEALKKIYPASRPYTGRNGTNQLLNTTAYMLGSGSGLYYDYDVDGGRYVFGPATREFKSVLKFFAEAYRRGILDPDYASTNNEQLQSKLTSGVSFFYCDNTSFSTNYTAVLRKNDPTAVMECIPYLTNSYGQRRAIAYATDLAGSFYTLRADIKEPDTIIKFFDWCYSQEGSDITNYGKENVSFRYNTQGKAEYIPEYINQFKNQNPVYYAAWSDAGVTKLDFCPWAGNTEQLFEIQKMIGAWDAETDKFWNLMAQEEGTGGAFKPPVDEPPISTADAERAKEITMALSTFLEQEYNKYIMGIEAIDNWDRVIERAIALGAKELENIYNKANAPYKN
jgi:ABC-type glycerol-3-phosphate transport system substrate-binding protein